MPRSLTLSHVSSVQHIDRNPYLGPERRASYRGVETPRLREICVLMNALSLADDIAQMHRAAFFEAKTQRTKDLCRTS